MVDEAHKETSEEIATVAGRIMAIQRAGGPIKHFDGELRTEFGLGDGDSAVFDKLEKVFGSYFDDAASLAGSALSQKEPDEDS
jgi:hypothetical protein